MDTILTDTIADETASEEIIIDGPVYNRHYIMVDTQNRIIDGWSDGPHSDKDIVEAICINEQGTYQFRLFPDDEENPVLFDWNGMIPLYKWDGEVVKRTEDEIEADRAKISKPAVIAPRNIIVGEYITVNNVLYKATANIPNGGEIIVGQNAEETTIEAQLYELTKGE